MTLNLEQRVQPIELLLSDVDGVMTDGGVAFDNQGIEIKQFHIRDGLGIQLWRRAGYRFGMITGRSSHIVRMRGVELGIEIVRQGVDDSWRSSGRSRPNRGSICVRSDLWETICPTWP